LIENGVAQALGLLDFQLGLRQAHFQRAGNGKHRPLLHASLEGPRFVDIDHDHFLFLPPSSPRLRGNRYLP
jgi:hypothetical protein